MRAAGPVTAWRLPRNIGMFSSESASGELVKFVTLEQYLGPSVRDEAPAAAFNFGDCFDSRNLALEQLSRLLVVVLVQSLRKAGADAAATAVRGFRDRPRARGPAGVSVEIQGSQFVWANLTVSLKPAGFLKRDHCVLCTGPEFPVNTIRIESELFQSLLQVFYLWARRTFFQYRHDFSPLKTRLHDA